MNNDITSKKVLNYQEIYESIHVTLTLVIKYSKYINYHRL